MRPLVRIARWWRGLKNLGGLAGGQWTGSSFVDRWNRNRSPTPNELVAELKGTAWTCASINAGVCATYPPSLYVATESGQSQPKCRHRPISTKTYDRLHKSPHLAPYLRKAQYISEVIDHPLLTLLARPNPYHNQFDLWELTTLYQECVGSCYWYLEDGTWGPPGHIWILPAQNVRPQRLPSSPNSIDYYSYRTGGSEERLAPSQVVHFRYPDPKEPYSGGISPLRAVYEQVMAASDYAAFKAAKFENRAVPDAIISPDEVLGEEERDRLEAQWNTKFRRGGAGKVVVAESGLKVQLLQQSLGDLAALADVKVTKEDIANAFHVPLSMLSTNTNLANLQASTSQHMTLAIGPRLERRDEKLNECLVPLFDDSGRLFLSSEDPIPVDQNMGLQQQEADLKYGVVSINEIRGERGLPPVPWGEQPWLPMQWAPTSYIGRAEQLPPVIGRDKPPKHPPLPGGNPGGSSTNPDRGVSIP